MDTHGIFPFGRKVLEVRQADRTRKEIFILGVYASAVHARWIDQDSRQKVRALAVASEPRIFWKGDDADKIVSAISIPAEIGRLLPADRRFNGPSGVSLDNRFLTPLGISRNDCWLCDIYPFAMVNSNQIHAISQQYEPLISNYGLPMVQLEKAPTRAPGDKRIQKIIEELKQSGASVLVLLGDRPIQWFLRRFQSNHRRLADFGIHKADYGKLHSFTIDGNKINVLPLVHPRQASRLGTSSQSWGRIHDEWVQSRPSSIL